SFFFFFSSRRRHTRFSRDWSSDVCSSDLNRPPASPSVVDRSSLPPPVVPPGVLHGSAAALREFMPSGRLRFLQRSRRLLHRAGEIGRASCRERGWGSGGGGAVKREITRVN